LSELNLVYILLEEGYRPFGTEVHKIKSVGTTPTEGDITVFQRGQASVAASGNSAAMGYANRFNSSTEFNSNSGDTTATNTPQNSGANSGADISEQIATAEKYIAQKQWASALRELREAVKRDQNHSRAHALLGLTYMNQKLMGMAKVSFQQALKINPKEELALKYIAEINGENKSQNTSSKNGNGKTGGGQEGGDKNKKGGFFGWLGGG
jgi:tetratricopeptide (TPR) repeat protein